ncbi:hypothetical protein EON79_12390 [bacterium]|nr:MAG: hypothetical protein EON79_12390 [bacterium]
MRRLPKGWIEARILLLFGAASMVLFTIDRAFSVVAPSGVIPVSAHWSLIVLGGSLAILYLLALSRTHLILPVAIATGTFWISLALIEARHLSPSPITTLLKVLGGVVNGALVWVLTRDFRDSARASL